MGREEVAGASEARSRPAAAQPSMGARGMCRGRENRVADASFSKTGGDGARLATRRCLRAWWSAWDATRRDETQQGPKL